MSDNRENVDPSPPAAGRIRVLNIEDSVDDSALLRHALMQGGYEVELTRIETRDELAASLDAGSFDVVLADHSLPSFTAAEALAYIRERRIDVPFIVVSGVITEELAVSLLREGAADYVLKDRLGRLEQAVGRALRERDLRRRKEGADRARMHSEALQRSILESLEAHIAVLDADGRIVEVNAAWRRFARANGDPDFSRTGVGTNYLEVCRRAGKQDASARQDLRGIEAVLSGRKPSYRCEYPCHSPTHKRWFSMQITPLVGTSEGVVISHQNITERRKAEKKQYQTRALLKGVTDASLDALLVLNAVREEGEIVDFEFAFVNPRMSELEGRPPEATLGKRMLDLWPGMVAIGVFDLYKNVVESGEPVERDLLFDRGGGSRWFTVTGVKVGDGLAVTLRDITDRREAEANRRQLAAIVESSGEAIMGVSRDGKITSWNAAAERLYGYTANDAIDSSVERLFTGERRAETTRMLSSLGEGKRIEVETVHRRKNGSTVEVELSIAPIFDSEGAAEGAAVIARNISEQKNYIRRTLEAKARAEEMVRLKSAFLANMSHEIRTPLTGIIGFADILAAQVANEHQELAEYIALCGNRLMETLTSVLDLAQLESGYRDLKMEKVDAVRLVRQTVDLLRPQAVERGLALSLQVQGGGPFTTLADGAALNRITTNLCANAVKFTREGGVEVVIRQDDECIHVDVKDSGVGIDAGFLPHIFDEYAQESTGENRDFEGAGLGLTISKRLAAMMGAHLTVETVKGFGSTFTLSIPRTAPSDSHSPMSVQANATVNGRHDREVILLVDAHKTVHQVVPSMIGDTYDVDSVGDGQTALSKAAETVYAAVLLDVDLGAGMSGEKVMRELRSARGYQSVPVIAMTAHALEGDRTRLLVTGFDGYIIKPFRGEDLRAELERVCAGG